MISRNLSLADKLNKKQIKFGDKIEIFISIYFHTYGTADKT